MIFLGSGSGDPSAAVLGGGSTRGADALRYPSALGCSADPQASTWWLLAPHPSEEGAWSLMQSSAWAGFSLQISVSDGLLCQGIRAYIPYAFLSLLI